MREGRGSERDARKQTSGAVPVPHDGGLTGSNPGPQGAPPRPGTLRRARMRHNRAFQGTREKRLAG